MSKRITKKELERRTREKREYKRSQTKIKKLRKKPKRSKFYRDVNYFQEAGGYSFKKAKQKVYYSPKWAGKRAIKNRKELLSWPEVNKHLRDLMPDARRKKFYSLQLDYEFYS